MTPTQVDLTSPFTTAAAALRYEDLSRANHERYLEQVETAISQTDGRKRRDAGTRWARPQLQAEALLIRKNLDRADAAIESVLEPARTAYRAACERYGATDAEIAAATDVDVLLRARAQLELDGRAATAARVAFATAAAKAKLPGLQTYPLWRGKLLEQQHSDNAQLSGYGDAVAGYDPNTNINTSQARTAHEVIYNCRHTTPLQMVWAVAGEHVHRLSDPTSAVAFDARWEHFARRWDIAPPGEATAAE